MTVKIVAAPPDTTENTGPRYWLTIPDSNPPSSLEVPMNKLFTAETRPRISSGVSNCTNVCRTMTLTLSANPQINSIASDNQYDREMPKAIVAAPNTATAKINERPAFCIG